jgi:hypothetical protein
MQPIVNQTYTWIMKGFRDAQGIILGAVINQKQFPFAVCL